MGQLKLFGLRSRKKNKGEKFPLGHHWAYPHKHNETSRGREERKKGKISICKKWPQAPQIS